MSMLKLLEDIQRLNENFVRHSEMLDAGFKHHSSHDLNDDSTTTFYTHDDYPHHHFALNNDRRGVMYGSGKPDSGISGTVHTIAGLYHVLKDHKRK